MALDFPANPSDGQVFGSYIWDANKTVWKAREESAPTAILSPVAPTNAVAGDIWVNTSSGISFVYYNDGNTTQWMELLSSAVPTVSEIMPSGTIVQTARAGAPTGWLFCEGQAVSRNAYASLYAAIGTLYGSGDGSTTFNLPNLKGKVPVGKDSSGTFTALGATGGAETHQLTEAQMPRHTHSDSGHSHGNYLTGTTTFAANGHTHQHMAQGGLNSGSYMAINPNAGTMDWAGSYDFYTIDWSGSAWFGGGVGGNAYEVSKVTSTGNSSSASVGLTNVTGYAGIQYTGGSGSAQSASIGAAHNILQPYIVLNYMIKI